MDRVRLDRIVDAAYRGARAQRRIADESSQHRGRYSPAAFIGRSEAAARVRDTLARLCQVAMSGIVIVGETGTGRASLRAYCTTAASAPAGHSSR